jgi:hypothetical protein
MVWSSCTSLKANFEDRLVEPVADNITENLIEARPIQGIYWSNSIDFQKGSGYWKTGRTRIQYSISGGSILFAIDIMWPMPI